MSRNLGVIEKKRLHIPWWVMLIILVIIIIILIVLFYQPPPDPIQPHPEVKPGW